MLDVLSGSLVASLSQSERNDDGDSRSIPAPIQKSGTSRCPTIVFSDVFTASISTWSRSASCVADPHPIAGCESVRCWDCRVGYHLPGTGDRRSACPGSLSCSRLGGVCRIPCTTTHSLRARASLRSSPSQWRGRGCGAAQAATEMNAEGACPPGGVATATEVGSSLRRSWL